MTWLAAYFSAPWWTCCFPDDDVDSCSCYRCGGPTFPGPALVSLIADASVHCHSWSFYITNSGKISSVAWGLGGEGSSPTPLGDQLVNRGIVLASLSFIFLSPYRIYACFKIIGPQPF